MKCFKIKYFVFKVCFKEVLIRVNLMKQFPPMLEILRRKFLSEKTIKSLINFVTLKLLHNYEHVILDSGLFLFSKSVTVLVSSTHSKN